MKDTPLNPRHRRCLIVSSIFVPIAMLVIFIVMISIGPDEWVAIEARVLKTGIESQRTGGPPEWALIANFSYTVVGKSYVENSHEIFSNVDWGVVSAEQEMWPPGRTLIVYHHPEDPSLTSMTPDGGREAMAVMMALLTPMIILVFAFLTIFLRRHMRQNV